MKRVQWIQRRHVSTVGRAFAIALLALASWTAPANAINCQRWSRLSDADKLATIEAMIDNAIASNKGRSYEVSRAAIGRCMHRLARDIQFDFDDTCVDARTASSSALNSLFKSYIWSCAN